ncbi:hypothetical protein [Sporolactobacillus inulinus]|uniref:hypothetical protein n=1 Tax=Sporolactobacillus inulinus TaxID=2078 RepID=UPI00030F7F29|nr:hypothetical protein [Sporolactobacillus inulinus]GEB76173.1 hypothetical protein SIN01_05180 [Sporolactobacillus inulinus]
MIRHNEHEEHEEHAEPKETVDDKTVIVEGVGKATSVGELDMEKFIEIAMGLPSFWR